MGDTCGLAWIIRPVHNGALKGADILTSAAADVTPLRLSLRSALATITQLSLDTLDGDRLLLVHSSLEATLAMQLDEFILQLRKYSAGDTSIAEFQRLIDYVVTEGPTITRDEDENLSADFSIAVQSAMYLDMVNDPDSPGHDPEEARRLATSLANLASQLPGESAGLLAHFARWSRETAERSRAYLSGAESRGAFETFLSRRPWPNSHKAAVKQLPRAQLTTFVEGLENDDFSLLASAIADDIADE